jgi:hypothetical protein
MKHFTDSFVLFYSIDQLKVEFVGRKESIDLLETLDFDFINSLRDDEVVDGLQALDAPQEIPTVPIQQLAPSREVSGTSFAEDHIDMMIKNRKNSMDDLFSSDLMMEDMQMFQLGSSKEGAEGLQSTGIGVTGVDDDLDIFNAFAKDEDELRYHRSGSMGGMSGSPQHRAQQAAAAAANGLKKSLRLANQQAAAAAAAAAEYGEDDNVDLSAYANYAQQLQNNKENTGLYDTIGGAASSSSRKKGAEIDDKLVSLIVGLSSDLFLMVFCVCLAYQNENRKKCWRCCTYPHHW